MRYSFIAAGSRRAIPAVAALAGLAIGVSPGLGQIANPIPTPIPRGPVAIELQTVATGLTAPHHGTAAPGDPARMFVLDQLGQVRTIDIGTLLPAPFLDVTPRLVTPRPGFDERGLLGLAFHPQFATPGTPGFGKLYTYTSEPFVAGAADFTVPIPADRTFDHQSVVAEWQVSAGNPLAVNPASRRELMRFDQPQFNHNAGALAFSPDDGLLYIAVGDGGGRDDSDGEPSGGTITVGHGPGGNGQNVNSILGKVLRIDPQGANSANGKYGVPADNPFVGQNGIDEIWAYGLRNPFRMSFDKQAANPAQLLIADVGQNALEELNIGVKGGNFGWNVKEGTFLFDSNGANPGFVSANSPGLPAGMIDPVLQYDHDEGLSIIGGYVYRGTAIPELAGKYVFGDFQRPTGTAGRLFYADLATGEIRELQIGLDDRSLGLFLKGFGLDAQGEIYAMLTDSRGPSGNGSVMRLVAVPEPGAAAGAMLIASLGTAMGYRRNRGA